MNEPLDTNELLRLCKAVVKDIEGYNSDIPMAADWSWAQLVRQSLPELQKFLKENFKNS